MNDGFTAPETKPDSSHLASTLSNQQQPSAVKLLSVVVPTFNERDNVQELVRRLDRVLHNIDWEVIFVDDDSNDGTVPILRGLARSDARVRVLHRIGRRGLASAVTEGIQSTCSKYVAVMDADLQHDEGVLPLMLDRAQSCDCNLVIGSRYLPSASVGGWDAKRKNISRIATVLAQKLLDVKLSDPMSGFFVLDREAFDSAVRRLSNSGYKILLDIVVSARPPLKVVEVPYKFRGRIRGESKLDTAVAWEFFTLLINKLLGGLVPARFIMFAAVGSFGVLVHMLTLATLSQGLGMPFVTSQAAATVAAMTLNFFANNALTYRDKRLRGLGKLLRGLLSFYVICGIGAISNVGVATILFSQDHSWWASGLAGVLVGAVWNYAVTSIFTWKVDLPPNRS